jgi:hypothetical protein
MESHAANTTGGASRRTVRLEFSAPLSRKENGVLHASSQEERAENSKRIVRRDARLLVIHLRRVHERGPAPLVSLPGPETAVFGR